MSEEAVLQRLTAILLVLGGILVLVGTILVPRADDPGAVASVLAAYSGDEGSARVGTLAGSVGIWALVLGFANVHHFIGSGSGAAWGRIGFYGLILGAAGLTAAHAATLGTVEASGDWAMSPTDSALGAATGLVLASQSAFALSSLAFWTAVTFVGFAWTRSAVYETWSAWPLLAIAVASLGFALVRLAVDADKILEAGAAILVGLVAVWAIGSGGWLAYKAWQSHP